MRFDPRGGRWPEPVKHGTRYGYVGRKCRCPDCTQANTDYARARYRKLAYLKWAQA